VNRDISTTSLGPVRLLSADDRIVIASHRTIVSRYSAAALSLLRARKSSLVDWTGALSVTHR